MNILQINASARREGAHSTRLADAVVARLKAAHPDARHTLRDLAATPHPTLDEAALSALFTAPDRPTAMLVSDDILAVVLEQFCGKLGLRVPKDLSIVSFNNSLFSRITSPQLTTVDVNPYQLGMEAASQTINHIENPNLLATKIIVPHRLIQRESCCPPPEI